MTTPRLDLPTVLPHNLEDPEYDPPTCPAWARESFPEWLDPYRGRNGLSAAHRDRPYPLARNVRGIDRYQANQFIVYRPETAHYLYDEYTSLQVNYRPGLLPTYEALAAEVTVGCTTPTEKALALLTRGATQVKHPTIPPAGDPVVASRALDDEALLQSGLAWCNEQARVFVRLCQVIGIPARIVHLFYSDQTTGHCIAEFHADGRWCMADASWFCAFPGDDGKLLSAADCHDHGDGQRAAGQAYFKRFQELLAMSDEQLHPGNPESAAKWRRHALTQTAQTLADELESLAILNYPLPQ